MTQGTRRNMLWQLGSYSPVSQRETASCSETELNTQAGGWRLATDWHSNRYRTKNELAEVDMDSNLNSAVPNRARVAPSLGRQK